MIVEKTELATIFKIEKLSIDDFYSDFSKKYANFKNENIIIDFSKLKRVDIENILVFLPIVKEWRNNGMSFVIVLNEIETDILPDEMNVVPTLVEAKDIVEMENIERDLGF
ncbi:ribonuclease Z [Aureibaculum marinum]|uniref:Ribonuclease Z n=1 Tax=Aureibaculum marinum TaxID=2487930 RepID=A0A3N4NPK1_9FLAO|nr:ribonuclease Z [Aureibaculum marinum]RPD98211.1 ribonuclease Z [Aureibaculum marinum]